MTNMVPAPLRLSLDGAALVANWRWLQSRAGGAACGAAVKANGYGLGAVEVVRRLRAAGCTDFFVASWAEAAALAEACAGASLAVLHGVRTEDMSLALTLQVRPVLNSAAQVARWRAAAPDRPCDVMVDTGMNRLGLSPAEAGSGLLDGVAIDTLISHLASADEDSPVNAAQLAAFRSLGSIAAQRRSLANSAGICLGPDYAFDLVRPGLALYGGVPRAEAAGAIRQVVTPEAQILQIRTVAAGQGVGYNHQWRAPADCRIAIINLGYADGYLRGFTNAGSARCGDWQLDLVGRVSMDLVALRLPDAADVTEGDWVAMDYDLPHAAAISGLSQYELLTGLGQRFDRCWR